MKPPARSILRFIVPIFILAVWSAQAGASPETVSLTVIATSDLHGRIRPLDYFTGGPAPGGIAQVATAVAGIRSFRDHVILVDNGDTIRGANSCLPAYYESGASRPHPMAVTMNMVGFDAMVPGNHEFNYGLDTLERFAAEASFPLLSANILGPDGRPFFRPYVVRSAGPVKVGIIGITTPIVASWEKPEHIPGLTFTDPVATARRYVESLRDMGVDVIIIAEHSGWESEPKNANIPEAWLLPDGWTPNRSEDINYTLRLANEVSGVDAIIAGHSHQNVPVCDERSGKIRRPVVVTQPGTGGEYISCIDLTLEAREGRWTVVERSAYTLSLADTPPDPAILDANIPDHDLALDYFTRSLGLLASDMPGGPITMFGENRAAALINAVQTAASGAEVSAAALWEDSLSWPAGPLSRQQIQALYPAGYVLCRIEVTGVILRAAIERSARCYQQYTGAQATLGQLLNPAIRLRDIDIYSGIAYCVDLRQPAGRRVTSLTLNGTEIADDAIITLAVSDYRAKGGGGYTMFRDCPVVWRSDKTVHDLIVEYVRNSGIIDPAAFQSSLTILPAEAASLPQSAPPAQPTDTPYQD